MKLAVFSDIHDNMHNLRLALGEMKRRNITRAYCLGDFINPGIVKQIIDSGIVVMSVWGNNDGEIAAITKLACQSNGQFQIADTTFMRAEVDGRTIFLSHHPDFAESLAKSGDFDAVFYGHNHIEYLEQLSNGCILANPGEISAHKTDRSTFLIWDTVDNSVVQIELEDIITVNN
jgi:putative phosphoesterase